LLNQAILHFYQIPIATDVFSDFAYYLNTPSLPSNSNKRIAGLSDACGNSFSLNLKDFKLPVFPFVLLSSFINSTALLKESGCGAGQNSVQLLQLYKLDADIR
jgi:hypothetical protein